MKIGRMSGAAAAVALALGALSALSACTPLPFLVGGAAVGASVAAEDRPVGVVVDDAVIRARVSSAMFDFDVDVFQQVSVDVREGRVLLTGLVPEPQNRIDAARLAWKADGVREVINEIEVSDHSTLSDTARDSWISTKLRGAIALDKQIRSVNYTVDTVNKTVYLMGIAQDQAELDRVINHARQIDYVRRVVPYVRIVTAENGG